MSETKKDYMFPIEIMEEMLAYRLKQLPSVGSFDEQFPPDYVTLYYDTVKQRDELKFAESGKIRPMEYTMSQKMFASKTALSKLKLTTLPELNLDDLATGKYILVRVMEEWHRSSVTACVNVLEDHRGHVVRFVLYNYPLDETIYPGEVISIKEPYLWSPVDKNPTIRCNSPTDIVVVRPTHPLYPKVKKIKWNSYLQVNDLLRADPCPNDSLQWKVRGNELFARGELILSREAYNIGLEMCADNDPISKHIQLNLLAVQLRLEYFEWVVEKGETFLQKFPEEDKAYFRLGKAYHMLRNYEKALETYEKLCEKFKENKIGPTELEKAKERIRETKGEFDFIKLRKFSLEKPFQKIECADFCGPVKITKVPGKGRGLVLTEDVRAGSLLIVSKALAVVLNRHEYLGVPIDGGEEQDWNLIKASVAIQLARIIMKNPKTIGAKVYDLDPGINNKEPVQLFCGPELKNEPISNMELIKNIATNSFDVGGRNFLVSGLFLLPAYTNHSCIPNVRHEFYNDLMVVKALEDMTEGTELTCSYLSPQRSFEQRTKFFEEHGFKCYCAKCENRL